MTFLFVPVILGWVITVGRNWPCSQHILIFSVSYVGCDIVMAPAAQSVVIGLFTGYSQHCRFGFLVLIPWREHYPNFEQLGAWWSNIVALQNKILHWHLALYYFWNWTGCPESVADGGTLHLSQGCGKQWICQHQSWILEHPQQYYKSWLLQE